MLAVIFYHAALLMFRTADTDIANEFLYWSITFIAFIIFVYDLVALERI